MGTHFFYTVFVYLIGAVVFALGEGRTPGSPARIAALLLVVDPSVAIFLLLLILVESAVFLVLQLVMPRRGHP